MFEGFEDDYTETIESQSKSIINKKIVITQTDYEILMAFRDNGFSR